MFRRKSVLAGLFVVAFAVIALFPAIALADNSDCLGCHQSAVGTRPAQNFVVAPVNYATACSKCHLNFAGSHPYHNTDSYCGALCHDGWGAALSANVPNYSANLGGGVMGGFASANSTSTDPALLHIIHSKPRWMEDKSFVSSSCKSCHAMVACDACHEGAPDPATHATHAATLSPTSTNNVSRGVLFGNQADPNGYTPLETSTCGAAICHDTAGVTAGSPGFKDDSVHIADPTTGYLANPTVVKTGAWLVIKASAYTLGKTSSSNASGATLSIPFNGSQVALVADKDPYRGIAEILIDNVSTGTVDLYNDTTVNQVEVWRSAKLASGDHTITVRVTGTKRLAPVAARGAYIRVDAFKIYTNAPGLLAPGCTKTGCHLGYEAGHGGGKKHALTISTSTYADGSGQGVETGCLSSGGGGCHDSLGASNVSTDIAGYHQTTQCATSVCHTSVSKPTHHEPFVCGDCHDSTYAGAVDTTALADLSPAGHYIDASHLATGGIAAVNTGGTANETCSVCHDLSLKTAHTNIATPTKGTKVTCGECHNYSANVTGQVKVFKWTNGACSDCHNATTMVISPQHANALAVSVAATGSAGCASSGLNCHNTADLHTIHKNAATGCDLAGCHDATNKNIRPTKKSCGATGTCHTTYNTNTTFGTHTNSQETTNHAPLNTTQQTQVFLGNTCNACHVVAKADGGLVTEHASTTSTRTTNAGNVCLNCHNNAASTTAITSYWSASETATACAQCHTAALAVHADANATAHTKTTNTGCGNSGPGCHPTNDLSQVGTPSTTANIHSTCLRCHDRTGAAAWTNAMLTTPGNVKWDPAANKCGQATGCHTSGYYSTATMYHRIGQADVTNGDDTVHHTANATAMTSVVTSGTATNTCNDCHIGTLTAEHATTSIGAVGCTTGGSSTKGCHNTNTGSVAASSAAQVKANWTNDTCADCHSAQHNAIGTVHVGTSTQGCGASGAGCHTTYDLVTLHKGTAGGCKFAGCHDAANKSKRPTLKTCGSGQSCHTAYTATVGHRASTITGDDTTHTADATYMATKVDGSGTLQLGCTGCHASTLMAEHTSAPGAPTYGPAITCTECHNSPGTTGAQNSAVTVITGTWTKQCAACHTATRASGHATATAGPHAVTDGTMTVGGAGCTSCHANYFANIATAHSEDTTIIASVTYNTCNVCHRGSADTSMTVLYPGGVGGWTCVDCHPGKTATHTPSHDGALTGTVNGIAYADGTNVGCFAGCHNSDLMKEHLLSAALAGAANRTLDGSRGSGSSTAGCTVCHTSADAGFAGVTAGAYAGSTSVRAAIAAKDYRCSSCHNQTSDNASGVQMPHMSAYGAAGTDGANLPSQLTVAPIGTTLEFQNWAALTGKSGGGHNAFGSLNYPDVTAQTFTGTFQTGWSVTSRVKCSDCHDGLGGTGPQGASVSYGLVAPYVAGAYFNGAAPYRYPNDGAKGLLTSTSTTTYGLCSKCHATVQGQFHGANGAHDSASTAALTNLPCINCHLRIPHAWKRPRLLRRVVGGNQGSPVAQSIDATPYALPATSPGLVSFGAAGVSQGTCNENMCSHHNYTTDYWP